MINFRQFEFFQADHFHSQLNVIVGPNAQGKTSLLEALSLITQLKSFRTNKSAELIKNNQTQSSIKVEITKPTATDILVSLEQNQKQIRMDSQKISSRSKYQFLGSSVSFIPDDLYLIKGSPEGRREYIDSIAVSAYPQSSSVFQQFQKILKQRNQLLKKFKQGSEDPVQLRLWTKQYITSAVQVYEQRQKIIEELRPMLNEVYQQLFRSNEDLNLSYEHGYSKSVPDFEDIELRLLRVSEAEKAVGYSLVGPHRDDLSFSLRSLDARNFASQGQTRSLVVAMKIAQLELIRRYRGIDPILLLDDIISELDDQRVAALVEYLSDYSGQLFVTTAEIDKLKKMHQSFPAFNLIELTPADPKMQQSASLKSFQNPEIQPI